MATKKIKKYKRNFLKSVVIRLDFDSVDLDFLEDFSIEIEKIFPLYEKKEENSIHVLVDKQQNTMEQKSVPFWVYQNLTKKKRFVISSSYCYLEFIDKSYERYPFLQTTILRNY